MPFRKLARDRAGKMGTRSHSREDERVHLGAMTNAALDPQCRMSDYATCIWGTRFRRQFDGALHEAVLSFRGTVRSFKSLPEMTGTDRADRFRSRLAITVHGNC